MLRTHVRAVVARFGWRAGPSCDPFSDLVSVQQARSLDRRFLAFPRRPEDRRRLGNVVRLRELMPRRHRESGRPMMPSCCVCARIGLNALYSLKSPRPTRGTEFVAWI